MTSLQPQDIYSGIWSHDDLVRDTDEPQEDSARETWAVFQNGELVSLQLYASEDYAYAAAAGWAKSYPYARIEYARIDIYPRYRFSM